MSVTSATTRQRCGATTDLYGHHRCQRDARHGGMHQSKPAAGVDIRWNDAGSYELVYPTKRERRSP